MQEQFRLDGKVVLVSGGSRGLGRGLAHAVAAAGANVMIAARGQDQLDATVEELRAAGGIAASFRADVTDSAQVNAMVAACVQEYGALDVVFANVGGSDETDADFWDYPDEAFQKVLDTNLTSVFSTCRAAAKVMVESGRGGVIIPTSSVGAYRASKRWASAVAKGGVVSLTKVLSGMLAPHGIRVNSICPGILQKDEPQTDRDRGERAQRGGFVPVDRMGEWWELGALAVYLASDASSYVTGQDFAVDGGMLNAGIAPVRYRPHHEI